MNIYDYLFYKIHIFTKRLGNYDVAFSSTMGFSSLLIINSLEILFQFRLLTKHNFNDYKILLIVFWTTIMIFNYFRFVHNKKYKIIEKRYSKIDIGKRNRISSILVSTYVLLTFFLIFVVKKNIDIN